MILGTTTYSKPPKNLFTLSHSLWIHALFGYNEDFRVSRPSHFVIGFNVGALNPCRICYRFWTWTL